MYRDLFAQEALAQIPKILTLLDRHPHSPTYGCFDRNFWHYKTVDFPSGMVQELVLPLALVYNTKIPGNYFYRQPSIRDWVEAGILYAVKNANKNGSCIDYLPYCSNTEATAFSLLASIESYQLLELTNYSALRFFEKQANWLAKNPDIDLVSHRQAVIILCLELLTEMLQTAKWDRAKNLLLEKLLDRQSSEGWFLETAGCDPGYHTLTISCLARLYEIRQNDRLKEAIEKAVKLASYFIHPDGSYSGEYGSRDTYNFFPHGFELVGNWMPEALEINDKFLRGIANGLNPCYADDRMIAHHTSNYLLAWRDYVSLRPPQNQQEPIRIWLKEAGILIDRQAETELYIGLNKGGVFKLFRGQNLITSDTQISLQLREKGKIKTAVAHLIDYYTIQATEDEIIIQGSLSWVQPELMTPTKTMLLRLLMLIFGYVLPDFIRQKIEPTSKYQKQQAPFRFYRRFRWENNQCHVLDVIYANVSWNHVISVGIGSSQTSIDEANSCIFQWGQLQPWIDLTDEIKKLTPEQPLKFERYL